MERKRDKERDGTGGKEMGDFVGEDQRDRERGWGKQFGGMKRNKGECFMKY